ncbi:hypothetical protein [Nonomuraea sp. bgisy101]|uniref:hypothetical protein n=1 Tax=Nonomuraea sp. bgisy101 TaxID=3413784 RepID=UPI003D720298
MREFMIIPTHGTPQMLCPGRHRRRRIAAILEEHVKGSAVLESRLVFDKDAAQALTDEIVAAKPGGPQAQHAGTGLTTGQRSLGGRRCVALELPRVVRAEDAHLVAMRAICASFDLCERPA